MARPWWGLVSVILCSVPCNSSSSEPERVGGAMTTIHTAHGPGELVETETVHGRTSYRVRGPGFDVWVDATAARTASGDGPPENLFTYQFSPDKVIDPDAYIRGAATYAIGSRGFAHDPALHVNERNTTTLPYNPTPQVDALTTPGPNQSWGPGEYGQIDPDERLRPSDSLSLRSRGEDKGPGPKPNLFATSARSSCWAAIPRCRIRTTPTTGPRKTSTSVSGRTRTPS